MIRLLCSFAIALAVLSNVTALAKNSASPGYSDYNEFRLKMESIGTSKYATIESLGRTIGKREIYLLRVGTNKVDEKPAILIVGGVDSTQLAGSAVATGLAERLVREAKENKAVQKLLDRVTFYFIPRVAPDACEAFFQRPFQARIRNERPIDEDGDGKIDEDGPDDLDGDGWISQMRILDPAGEYIQDPDNARIMIKADPKKRHANRYRLLREGKDNDKDTKINEDPFGGTAFNRNFTFDYTFFGEGSGPHQVSEVETRAVADFAFSQNNIFLVWVFSQNENILRLWKVDSNESKQRKKKSLQEADLLDYQALAKAFKESVTRRDPPIGSDGKGSIGKWAYFHYGRPTIVTRPWWPALEEQASEEKSAAKETSKDKESETVKTSEAQTKDSGKTTSQDGKATEENKSKQTAPEALALEWFEKHQIDGFIPWKQFKHPDFPGRTVEIGGFRPFLRENPPAVELETTVNEMVPFLKKLGDLLPQIVIQTVKLEQLGGGLARVTVRVKNNGTLATMTKMGEINRQPIGLQIQLYAENGKLQFIDRPARRMIGRLAGGAEKELTWLVRLSKNNPKELRVRVWAPTVGKIESEIELTK